MGITRKIVGWLPYAGGMAAVIAAFEWVEYHTRGSTPLFGINPRCVESSFGRCFRLDTSIMSWDATLATWVGQGFWYLSIILLMVGGAAALVGAVSCALLLVRVARSPRQERLSRLADSRRLLFQTWGLASVLLAGIVVALLWAQMEIVALLVFLAGGFLGVWLAYWAESWADRYRHERFLARYAASEGKPAD